MLPTTHQTHPLSWNEIAARATAFAKEWGNAYREDAEAKPFWEAFFHVFGVQRRKVICSPCTNSSRSWGETRLR